MLTVVVVSGRAREGRGGSSARIGNDGSNLAKVKRSRGDGDVISGVHDHNFSISTAAFCWFTEQRV